MSASLFDRLGGEPGITRITSDLVDNHLSNPTIAVRFVDSDAARLKELAAAFVITGTGGPACYQGKEMRATHAGMNISDAEFMAVVDDAMQALDKNGIGQREKEEILFILYSLRPDVVRI
jgi:hemoglobin